MREETVEETEPESEVIAECLEALEHPNENRCNDGYPLLPVCQQIWVVERLMSTMGLLTV